MVCQDVKSPGSVGNKQQAVNQNIPEMRKGCVIFAQPLNHDLNLLLSSIVIKITLDINNRSTFVTGTGGQVT